MIKLRFGRFLEANWNHPMNTGLFNNACVDFGVQIVDSGEDVQFVDVNSEFVCDRPTIVFDRHDTSRVTPAALKYDDNPYVRGFAIPVIALDPDKSTANWVYNWHDIEDRQPKKPVVSVNTMLWNRCLGQGWTRDVKIPEKTIKASFCGIVHYPTVPFTENHRRCMVHHWPAKDTYCILNGVRHYFMNEQQQFRFAAESKVVVSPWGVTELSVRDYEAVLACSMMVKPRQSNMSLPCNPWNENTVYCNPDFSDLEEAIEVAAARYDKDRLMERRIVMDREGSDIAALAAHFCKAVKTCFT